MHIRITTLHTARTPSTSLSKSTRPPPSSNTSAKHLDYPPSPSHFQPQSPFSVTPSPPSHSASKSIRTPRRPNGHSRSRLLLVISVKSRICSSEIVQVEICSALLSSWRSRSSRRRAKRLSESHSRTRRSENWASHNLTTTIYSPIPKSVLSLSSIILADDSLCSHCSFNSESKKSCCRQTRKLSTTTSPKFVSSLNDAALSSPIARRVSHRVSDSSYLPNASL